MINKAEYQDKINPSTSQSKDCGSLRIDTESGVFFLCSKGQVSSAAECIKFFIFIAMIVVFWLLGRYFHIEPDTLEGFFNKIPVLYSAGIFILSYVVVTFFIWFSKDVFRVVAAVLFGAYISTIFVFAAEILNAFILFFLSRYLGRGFVEKMAGMSLDGFDKKLEGIGFFWLVMFRLSPLSPFRFMDMAAGLTNIPFKKYLLAVFLGSPLRIFWMQFIFAGVGKSIFYNPQSMVSVMTEYLLANKTVFLFNCIYLILIIIVALKIGRPAKAGRS